MEQKGSYDYTIDSRDVDYKGGVTFTSMVHYILQAAGADADRNGFGVRDLNFDNCSWVLSRMSAEFFGWPAQDSTFTVTTWVSEVNRLMTTRNMEITCGDSLLAAAVTQWAIIDLDKRTSLDIRRHIDYSNQVVDRPCPIGRPVRVTAPVDQHMAEHIVAYSDLDFNRHMNSLRYLTLMYDMLPENYFARRTVRRADLNFIHEARYGQELTIVYEQAADSLFEVRDSNAQPLCRARLQWNV